MEGDCNAAQLSASREETDALVAPALRTSPWSAAVTRARTPSRPERGGGGGGGLLGCGRQRWRALASAAQALASASVCAHRALEQRSLRKRLDAIEGSMATKSETQAINDELSNLIVRVTDTEEALVKGKQRPMPTKLGFPALKTAFS